MLRSRFTTRLLLLRLRLLVLSKSPALKLVVLLKFFLDSFIAVLSQSSHLAIAHHIVHYLLAFFISRELGYLS